MGQTTTRPKTQPLENKTKQNKEAKPHNFIYQARLDYEQYINQNVNKYGIEVAKQIDKMRADAVGETYEYTKYDF